MTLKKNITIFLFAMLTISSCYKDETIIDQTTLISKDHPPIAISGNLVGIVNDEFGNEISDFSTKLMNETYHSYQTGYYHFQVKEANKNGTPIKITKENQQYEFTLKPINNEVNYFSHTIFTKPKTIEQSSTQQLSILFNNNSKLEINANSYLIANEKYDGEVNLKSFVPDLQNPIQLEALPGDHLAKDYENNEVWLDYYDAIYIDIKGTDNSDLTLEKNQAFVTLNSNTQECEKCIVWRYNDTLNIWKEHYNPSDYTNINFEITQSGFYCLATPEIYNLVEGKIHSDNVPFRNQAVDIYDNDKLLQRIYTTNNGKWFTHLPINREYKYKFHSNCSDKYEEIFSIAEEERNQISVPNIDKRSSTNIKGEIRDCKNELVNNHFLKIWKDNSYKCLFFNEADVDIDIINCSEENLLLQSANEFWQEIGPKLKYNEVNRKINFLRSYSCNDIKQNGYFNLKLDDKEKLLFLNEAIFINDKTVFNIYDLNPNMEMQISFSSQEARSYEDNELNIYFKDLEIDGVNYEINCKNSTEGCGFEIFNIEVYGDKKGAWIKGNFKGKFWVKSYDPLIASYKTIEADFLIPRNFN